MMKIRGSGSSGKDSGSARIAKEDSDSLQSKSYAQVLDLVSEGEIEGLVNGLHSVYLDDTPLVDESGNYNFSGVSFDSRTGTQFQDPIDGFSSSESETSVGVEVKKLSPVVRTITNSSVNAVNVRISIPQLTFQDPTNGDLKGAQVSFAIEVNSAGAGWVQKANDTIVGKCVSKYLKTYRVDLPTTGPHQIRVRKVTEDSTQSNLNNKIFWDSYGEVIDGKLRYPNSALMAVRVDASNFKSIPTRAYDLKLLKIKVPTNYDPILRSYTGIWDGTWKISWTDNPAFVLYDLLTNSRYGASLDPNLIDKFGLYKIAKYCDEWVDDGFGGKEPRFTINCYFQTRTEAYNIIKDLTSVFRGMGFWQAGTLMTVQDSPQDPSYLFTPSNVVGGDFQYQGVSIKNRYSVALVTWNDPADMCRTKVEYVEDAAAIQRWGINQVQITALGCSSQAQAHRVGRWAIYASQNETETVTFQTGIEAANLSLGKIIKIQDPMRAGSRMSGRISSSTSTSLTVDQDLNLDLVGNSYVISIMMSDGTIQERAISSYSGRQFFWSTPLTTTTFSQGVWMLSSLTVKPQLFRVVSVSEDAGKYSIIALEHNPEKYDYIEKNLKISDRRITSLSFPPEQPSGLKITETLYQSNGEVKSKATFSWNASAGAGSYSVSYRKKNGNTVFLGNVFSNEIEILNIDQGVFDFFVVATNSFGVESLTSSITYEVLGKSFPPANIQNFSLLPVNNMAMLSWSPTSDLDVQIGGFVRIRFSPNPLGTWKDSVDIALVPGNLSQATVPLQNGIYFAKFVDSSGSSSFTEASIKTDALSASILNVVATITESPNFLGTKTNMFFSSFYGGISIAAQSLIDDWTAGVDEILAWDYLGGVQSFGEYIFNNSLDLGGVYTVNISSTLDAASVDVADSIDMRSSVDSWLDTDGNLIDDVNAELWVQTSNDNVSWSQWKRIILNAQYSAQFFKFKLIAQSDSQNHNIIIRNLAVSVDMDDRVVNFAQLTSSTAGTSIVYDKPFAAKPSLGITAYNLAANDRWNITAESESGFNITFFDNANNPVARKFDVIAKGYGRKMS